jgi:hypothetical protein
MAYDPNQPERPRAEPEIIPPDRDGASANWRRAPSTPWRDGGFDQIHGTHRVYVGRVGPFGIALLLLAIAAIVAIILIAVLGAVLIWIPVIAVAVVVGAFFRLFRR